MLCKTGGDIECEPGGGKHVKIGDGATKALALHGDNCPYAAAMGIWMGQVEVICNSVLFPPPVFPVAPLAATFGPTAVATITATSTKGKGE